LSSVVKGKLVARTGYGGSHSGASGPFSGAGRLRGRGSGRAVQLNFESNSSAIGDLLCEDIVASSADSRLIEDGVSFVDEVAVTGYAKVSIVWILRDSVAL